MTDKRRLAQLLEECAREEVPDTLNLWPAVRDRLPARRSVSAGRRGLATLAAALAVVLIGVLLFAALERNDASAPYASSLQTGTATPTPTAAGPIMMATVSADTVNVLTLDADMLHLVHLEQDQQYILRYQANSDDTIRLDIEVITPGNRPPDIVISQEEVTLIAFNPRFTSRLSVTFTASRSNEYLRQLPLRLEGEFEADTYTTLRISYRNLTAEQAAASSDVVPPGMVAVSVPYSSRGLREGDRIDVLAVFTFEDIEGAPEFQMLVPPTLEPGWESGLSMQRIVSNALVIQVGPFEVTGTSGTPTPAADAPDMITLAVTPDEAAVLTWVLDSGLPLLLVPREE